MLARGSGTLTLNGSYTIQIDNGVGAYVWTWGSLTENLVGISFASVGSPQFQKVTYSKPAGLEVISLVVRYNRSSKNLS